MWNICKKLTKFYREQNIYQHNQINANQEQKVQVMLNILFIIDLVNIWLFLVDGCVCYSWMFSLSDREGEKMRTEYRIKSKMFGKDFFFYKRILSYHHQIMCLCMSIIYGISNRKAEILSLCWIPSGWRKGWAGVVDRPSI